MLNEDKSLVSMSESAYDSEALLQSLLADHPDLIPGDQIDRQSPRKWLLVDREFGISNSAESGAYWSLDHLFVDQDGVPTLVEVKRSTDTRIRREVVAQMLDYAANILDFAPVERIRAQFEARCEKRMVDPVAELAAFLGTDADIEAFWQRVKTNLSARKLRLLFVADVIPPELRRIVEYLNGQMRTTEVLAVEIRQYLGDGKQRMLVPTVLGQTAEAEQSKSSGGTGAARQWDEQRYFEDMDKKAPDVMAVARAVLQWGKDQEKRFPGSSVIWGSGTVSGSFYPVIRHRGTGYQFPGIWSQGYMEATFQYLRGSRPFDQPEKRLELLRSLNAIGAELPEDRADYRPSSSLTAFNSATGIANLIGVLDWYADQIAAADLQDLR